MKLKPPPNSSSSSSQTLTATDAKLLVRETLRISADLASSPYVTSVGSVPENASFGVVDREFVDSSLRLLCCEEIDGRRWKYFADESVGSEQLNLKKKKKKNAIRAVSLHSPQAPAEEFMSFIRSYVVPEGFPDSVTPSYVPYMTWRALKHFFGGAMGVFTTQTLLNSVGVSKHRTTPGAVAINWILKDGAGRVGKMLYARQGKKFDYDLKQLRFAGDLLMELGAGVELVTAVVPQFFLPLACAANVAKNVGGGVNSAIQLLVVCPQVFKMSDAKAPVATAYPKRKIQLVDFLLSFRWIIVIFFVLPFSFLYYFSIYLGDVKSEKKSYKQRQMEHDENVKEVVKRLGQRNAEKDGLVCTARPPWVVVGMRNVDYKRARHFEVDLSKFRNILDIDTERMVAKVEPLVNMGQMSRVTIPMNLSLAVLAELDDLTVGGLINGFGVEGSSHIFGLFSDTVVALEVVLADGKVVRATKDNEYSDLFYAIPWSQGTLGLLVSAEIKLIPVDQYVKLTYKPVRGNLKELAQAYADSFAPTDGDQDNPSKVPEMVEGMIYGPTEGVMMTGMYASRNEAKRRGNVINNYGWWFKPWFYQHAQTALKRGEFVEYIPTRDYYHRHTRSLYWEGKLILPFGDQFWFRFLLGWLMPPKIALLKATQSEAIRNYYHDHHVIQDLLVPLYKVGDCLEWVHREMEVYPIWLCPHRIYKLPVRPMIYPEPGFEKHKRQGDTEYAQMYTDVGVYYVPGAVLRGEPFDGSEKCRQLELWLIENHGFQAQYAVTELTEKNFWRMFDNGLYEQCRRKYKAIGTFMSVYYKSKKGRKTEKEVQEAEQEKAEQDTPEADEPAN